MGQSDSSKPSLFYLKGMAQKHCHKSAYACAFQHGSINPTPALYLLQAKMTSIEGLLAFWLLVWVHSEIWAMDQEGNTNSLLSIAKLSLGSEWIKCMLLSHCYQADSAQRLSYQFPKLREASASKLPLISFSHLKKSCGKERKWFPDDNRGCSH